MEQKKFKVSLFRYPEEFVVFANNEEEAKQIAKGRFSYSVWESKVKEADEDDERTE